MKYKYKFSKSNIILLILASLIIISMYVRVGIYSPFIVGTLIGALLSLLIFPSIFGWLGWRFSSEKNKRTNSSLLFNFFLIIVTFVSSGNVSKHLIAELNNQNKQFDQYIEDVVSNSKSKTGLDRKIDLFFLQQIKQVSDLTDKWLEIYQKIPNLEHYDYSFFKNKKIYTTLRNLLDEYISRSKELQAYMKEYLQAYKNHFTEEEQNQEMFKAYTSGVREGVKDRMPIIQELGVARVEYGESFLRFINILHNKPSQWRVENNELVIDGHDFFLEIKELNNLIDKNATIIYKKSTELSQMSFNN